VGDLLGGNILCFFFNYYFKKIISNTLCILCYFIFRFDLLLLLLFLNNNISKLYPPNLFFRLSTRCLFFLNPLPWIEPQS
jgi:hypothetical protein